MLAEGFPSGRSGAGTGFTDASDGFGIEHAYIELGGFRIGKTDSLFSTFTGYAGGVMNDHHGVGLKLAPYMRAQHGPALDVLRRIKEVLDPNRIMNPGKLDL